MSEDEYATIARALRSEGLSANARGRSVIERVVYTVAEMLEEINPRMDYEKFIAQCLKGWEA